MKRENFGKRLIAACFIGLMSSVAVAGPFGLEKGMTLKQIGGTPKQVKPGTYRISTVPKPHSAFESYAVQVAPKVGLCYVKGIGRDITTNRYGSELKHKFQELRGRLKEIYGEATKDYDILLPRSIWDEPQDWMMGLQKGDRIYAVAWQVVDGARLPDGLKYVALVAKATSSEEGYLALEYGFTNEGECEAEINKREDDAL